MTADQITRNDENAKIIETLTGNKPKRTDRSNAPLWFDILKLSITRDPKN